MKTPIVLFAAMLVLVGCSGGSTGSGGGGGSAAGGGTSAGGGAGGGSAGGGAGGGSAGGGAGGGAVGGGGGSAGGGAGGGAAGRTMIITQFLDFVWEGGDAGQRPSTTQQQMRVVVDSDAGPTYFNSVQLDAGVYAITGLPAGRLLLEYQKNRFLDAEGDLIALGGPVLRRPNASLGDAGTRLHAEVSGLAPWGLQTDQLNFCAANTSGEYPTFTQYATALPDGGSGLPTAGATSASLHTPWRAYLIDGAQGDLVRMVQVRYAALAAPGTDAGTVMVGSPVAFGTAAPFTMNHGVANPVAIALAPTTPGSTMAIDLRRSEAAALRPAIHPQAVQVFSAFYVGAIPLGYAKGAAIDYDGYPMLLQVYGPVSDTTDLAINVSYANPFPTSWTTMGGPFAQFTTSHLLAGGQPVVLRHSAVTFDEGAGLTTGPHRLKLSPPTALMVNGVAGDQTLTTLTPLVSWGPPAVGTPTEYRLNVFRLFLSASTPSSEFVGSFATERTGVAIPPGFLQSGQRYVIQLFAISNPGTVVKTGPFRNGGFPLSYAPAVSGTLIAP